MNLNEWVNKNKIPDIDYLTNKTLKYAKYKDWYKNSNKLIKKYYPQDYTLFIDILSITSPLTNVKTNTLLAIETVDNIKNKRNSNIVYGLANKQITNNLINYNKTKIFHGIKINNFAASLKLIDGSVCIDTWILKAFNLKRRTPTKYDIKYITRTIKNIADKLGLRTYEVQACLWVYAKTELNNTRFKKSHDFSYYLKAYFEQTKLDTRKTEILQQIPLDIKEKIDDAIYNHDDIFMSINLKECKKCAHEYKMNFYEYVARCINHEFIHYMLHMEHSYTACYKLDTLCRAKTDMCIDYWLW